MIPERGESENRQNMGAASYLFHSPYYQPFIELRNELFGSRVGGRGQGFELSFINDFAAAKRADTIS